MRLGRFASLHACKTLTSRFTDFFTDFEKKTRLFCSLRGSGQMGQVNCRTSTRRNLKLNNVILQSQGLLENKRRNRLSLIVRVNLVLNRTVVVDSD